MIKQISISSKFGWVSAYEINGKIFRVKFGKLEKQIYKMPRIRWQSDNANNL